MYEHSLRRLGTLFLGMGALLVTAAGCSRQPANPNGPIEPGEYTVSFESDDLSSIAVRAYGDMDLWYTLLNANPQLCQRPGFDLIMGETVTVPAKENLDTSLPKSVFPETLPADYIIMPGDSLYFIAQKCYGDRELWEVIYKANRDTLSERVKEDKRQLIAGEVLKIPAPSDDTLPE